MAIVANWKFNGNRNDYSGGGMTLSSVGTLQNSSGLNGNIRYNGTAGSATKSPSFQTISGSVSTVMWITNNSPSQTAKYAMIIKPVSGQDAILYGYVANTYETVGNRIGRYPIKNIGSDSKPHQIGFSYDGAQTVTYFDGVPTSVNSQSGGAFPGDGNFFIGGADVGGADIDADFDEVVFDNNKLPPSFFKNNYAFLKGFI